MNHRLEQGQWFREDGRIVVLLGDAPFPGGQISGEAWGEVTEADTAEPMSDALRRGLWSVAIRLAIQRGVRDENRLTDTVFYARHPERRNQRLQPHERALIQEWLGIRDSLVRPALRAAAAGAAPGAPAVTHPAAQPPSTTSGVEAAGNATHIIQCILGLQDQGRPISFVVRYLRDLGRAEAAALSASGLGIVSCYEESAAHASPTSMAYFTRAQGQHDGRRGFTQAQIVGQPSRTPVYFAVDTDPGIGQRQVILDYFLGVQEGFNQYLGDMQAQQRPAIPYAVGVYGSGCVLDWCRTQGIATWFWQAFAPGWCNNRNVWPGANIHTSGRDQPERCQWRLGRLEGWGNEGGWTLPTQQHPELGVAGESFVWR